MADFATEYKDLLTISFSALSFIVACIALFFSVRTNIRDKEKLLITARTVSNEFADEPYEIEVTVANVGRRVAVIEGIQRHYERGIKCHNYKERGIPIRELERVVMQVSRDMVIDNGIEGDVHYLEDITVLDIQGQEHKIKNSKELVKRLVSNF
ncbi:hypothetical protein I5M90_04870 [Serratia marcescens]|uniref:hypothetical protein n=1 Tax=Serratia marcescens TaxID=615 RepID=UPI000A3ADDCA|nr:hypothetical protein [Serratia marcescens]MBH2982707.1 hypothetical protein [Serratia marcescens]